MKIEDVAAALERFAPLPLQESYDNAGLQIGLTGCEDVSGVLLCLDVTEEIILEAERKGCNLIVSHHPLLFRPLRRIDGSTQVGRCVMMAVSRGIAIYSAHTNLDNAPGGVSFEMGRRLGLTKMCFLQEQNGGQGGSGVLGELPQALDPASFIQLLKRTFKAGCVSHTALPEGKTVRRVALCGGAGDFLIDESLRLGADAFVTGEMGYHRYFGHTDEILLAVLGHNESERFTPQLIQRILAESCKGLRMELASTDTNPVRYDIGNI